MLDVNEGRLAHLGRHLVGLPIDMPPYRHPRPKSDSCSSATAGEHPVAGACTGPGAVNGLSHVHRELGRLVPGDITDGDV